MEFAKFGANHASSLRLKSVSVITSADSQLLHTCLLTASLLSQWMRKGRAASRRDGLSFQEKSETAFRSVTQHAMKSKFLFKC